VGVGVGSNDLAGNGVNVIVNQTGSNEFSHNQMSSLQDQVSELQARLVMMETGAMTVSKRTIDCGMVCHVVCLAVRLHADT
jgi:hypothetical protein